MSDSAKIVFQTLFAFVGGFVSIEKLFEWSNQDKFSILFFIGAGTLGAVLGWVTAGYAYTLFRIFVRK